METTESIWKTTILLFDAQINKSDLAVSRTIPQPGAKVFVVIGIVPDYYGCQEPAAFPTH